MPPREPGVENGPAAAAPYGCLNRAAESVAHVREAIMTGRGLLRASALVIVLLLSFGLNAADAKPKRGDELQTLNQNVDKLFQAAKYPEAAEAAQRALAVAERRYKPNDRRVLDALTQVVQIYRAQGRFAEAEEIVKKDLPPDQAAANVAYLKDMLRKDNPRSGGRKPVPLAQLSQPD